MLKPQMHHIDKGYSTFIQMYHDRAKNNVGQKHTIIQYGRRLTKLMVGSVHAQKILKAYLKQLHIEIETEIAHG